jgi:membrane protease YdiL (CAAX protease family)
MTETATLSSHAERSWRRRLGRHPAWIALSVVLALGLMTLQPLLALPFIVLFAWLSGLSARDLRLRPFRLSHVVLGVLAAIGLQIVNRFLILPLLALWLPEGASSAAASVGLVPGAWQAFLIFAPIAVVSAGFGEELAARGYAMTRLACLFGDTRTARWLAMVLVALLFGLAHFYQGPLGTAHAIWMGLALGALTLLRGSLWVSIAAHGSYNLLTALLIVSGALDVLHRTIPWTAL